MIENEDRKAGDGRPPAANDNGNGEAWPRIDATVPRIARLIGRRIAREEFERQTAANDNCSSED
jgi:hypothetical protein